MKELRFFSLPFNKGGVLVLIYRTPSGKPASDMLNVGKSKKPAKRILGGYLAGYGGKTTRKINSRLLDDGYIEKVAVSWMPTDNPKASQQLLESFKKEHGGTPLMERLEENLFKLLIICGKSWQATPCS